MKILFLPGTYHSPSARFRIWQFVEPLRTLGHTVDVRVVTPNRDWESSLQMRSLKSMHQRTGAALRFLSAVAITADVEKFDVVFMNRDIVPEIRVPDLESWLLKRNPHLIFDFDDAIHLGTRKDKLEKFLPGFAYITPGNEYLADFARRLNPHVQVLPTVVDTEKYQPAYVRQPGPLRIGWSGSRSTLRYCLPIVKDVISDLVQTLDFEFIVIADVKPDLQWKNVKWRYIPWTAASEVSGLQQIDIGLMPLQDEPFERGKCGLKAIQYMGVGVPALVSPVGVNAEIVIHGKMGYHCANAQDWKKYIWILANDEKLREEFGQAARARVLERYSTKSVLPGMINLFERVTKL